MPFQPLAPLGFQAVRATAPRRRAQQAPPLSEEEQASLLQQGIGALSYVAETLDKPGSAVRGLLAGQPEQLLNLIPFSDTLGITDEQGWFADSLNQTRSGERVSGRELLETWGIAPENQLGFFNSVEDSLWDVGGFLTEVGLDPLMLVRGPTGALTSLGLKAQRGTQKVAKGLKGAEKQFIEQMAGVGKLGREMGTTPAAMANEIEAGERALFALQVPFTKSAWAIPGTSGKKAAKLLRAVTYGGGRLNPIIALRGALSHTAGDVFDGAAQLSKDLAFSEKVHLRGALQNINGAMRDGSKRLESLWNDLADYHGKMGDSHSVQEFGRELAEMQPELLTAVDGMSKMQKYIADLAGGADNMTVEGYQVSRQLGEEMHDILGVMTRSEDAIMKRLQSLGGNISELQDDFATHLGRTPSNAKVLKRDAQKRAKLFNTGTPFAIARNKVTKNYPMGTSGFNDATRNALLTGTKEAISDLAPRVELVARLQSMGRKVNAKATDKQLRAEIKKFANESLQTDLAKRLQSIGVDVADDAGIAQLQTKLLIEGEYKPAMARVVDLGKITPEEAALKIDAFVTKPNQIADDLLEQAAQPGLSEAAQDTIKEAAKELRSKTNLSPAEELQAYLRGLPREITDNGLFDRPLIDDWFTYMETAIVAESNLRTMHHFLGGKDIVRAVEDLPEGTGLVRAWKDAGLKSDGLETFMQKNLPGESAADYVIDERTAKVLTAYQQSMKPATVGKMLEMWDKTTAVYKGYLTIPAPAFHGRNLAAGFWSNWADGEIGFLELAKGYNRGILHIQTQGKQPLSHVEDILHSGMLEGHGRFVEIAGEEAARQIGGLPERYGILSALLSPDKWRERGWTSFNPLAMRGVQKEGQNVLMAAGEKTYGLVEFLNRDVPYSLLVDKGFTPAQAAYRVKRMQFDYSQLSKFEKSFMRRLVPFYCVPTDCEILTREGWKTYDKLSIGEEVMGYDVESHTQQWTTVEDISTFDYNGQMMSISKSKCGAEWLFTPDHRWPVRRITANGGQGDRKMVKGYEMRSNHSVPYTAPMTSWESDNVFSSRDAAVIGWLVTDGHMRKKDWAIYQSEKKFTNVIRGLLGEDSLKEYAHPDTGVVRFTIRAAYVNELKAKGFRSHEDLSRIIGRLSQPAAKAMWKAMYQADGTVSSLRNADFLAATKPLVRDAVEDQEPVALVSGCGHCRLEVLGPMTAQPHVVEHECYPVAAAGFASARLIRVLGCGPVLGVDHRYASPGRLGQVGGDGQRGEGLSASARPLEE